MMKSNRANPWQCRLFSLFLLAQALFLAYYSAEALSVVRLENISPTPTPDDEIIQTVFTYLFLMMMAIPLIPAAIGVFFRLRVAWLLSMLSQAAILLFCLILYFNWRPMIIYPVMACSIIVVFYLNSYSVRIQFQKPLRPIETENHE